MSRLRPCPRCARHVRIGEPTCPFCESELDANANATTSVRAREVGRPAHRAALVFFGAAATLAACTGGPDPGPTSSSSSGGSSSGVASSSGGSSSGASSSGASSSGTSSGASSSSGGEVPPYGVPPIDAGED